MAELALGALGVVPLIGFTIKSYQALYTTVKTFRHCSSNVERLRKKLRSQRCIFENGCQLLLRECLQDDADVEGMMGDLKHDGWLDHAVQTDAMKRRLKHNFDTIMELVQDICEAIRRIQTSMKPFEAVVPEQAKVRARGFRMIDVSTIADVGCKERVPQKDVEARRRRTENLP